MTRGMKNLGEDRNRKGAQDKMQGRKHRSAKGKREATKAGNLGGNKAESGIVRGREGEQ